jgi:hypothetical protein
MGFMKALRSIAVAAVMVAVAATGCGRKYDKPLEVYKVPSTGAYNYAQTLPIFDGARNMSMAGGNIFVTFTDSGRAGRYFNNGRRHEDVIYEGLVRPTVIGAGLGAVAVADSTGPDSTVVRVYELTGGAPVLEIRDPDWGTVAGLAVDGDGNIYVADTDRDMIRSYDTEGNLRFGTDLADSGFGIGHVLSPRGVSLSGDTLYIAEADPEKAQVQRILTESPQQGVPFSAEIFFIDSFTDEEGAETRLVRPVDVVVDDLGRILVLDEALGKIFRYTPEGHSDAVVNDPDSSAAGPDELDGAVSLGTYLFPSSVRENVFCLETSTGTVHRWEEAESQRVVEEP